MHLLDDCPLALSVGEETEKGYGFVWTPKMKPFFADARYIRVSCPKSRRYEASYVKNRVPHFRIRLDSAPAINGGDKPAGYGGGGSRFYPSKSRGKGSSYTNRHKEHIEPKT